MSAALPHQCCLVNSVVSTRCWCPLALHGTPAVRRRPLPCDQGALRGTLACTCPLATQHRWQGMTMRARIGLNRAALSGHVGWRVASIAQSTRNWVSESVRPRVFLGASLIGVILLIPACGDTPVPNQQSIVECGLERVVGPLKNNPNSMQRAAELYDLLQKGNEVDGVVRQVYGKDPSRLTDAEIDEVILILGGLDSCAATSPELKAALTGTIGILRSLLTQKPIPDPKRLGPALCAGEDPFDGKPHRFQPNCGEPSLEGSGYLTERSSPVGIFRRVVTPNRLKSVSIAALTRGVYCRDETAVGRIRTH